MSASSFLRARDRLIRQQQAERDADFVDALAEDYRRDAGRDPSEAVRRTMAIAAATARGIAAALRKEAGR